MGVLCDMKVSVVTVVRNEEELIAKHLVHLAGLGDEVVVVVQESADCTALFVQEAVVRVAGPMGVPVKLVPHKPDGPGAERSFEVAFAACSHDWAFYLAADESYVGRPLKQHAKVAAAKTDALAIPRWSAVGKDDRGLFTVEQYKPQVRLIRRAALPAMFPWALHHGLNAAFPKRGVCRPEVGQIMQYKGPARHYARQLWLESVGARNERGACEAQMPKALRRLGYQRFRTHWAGRDA
jgi:glycosyltransferase involved in cell wall biosynthesis